MQKISLSAMLLTVAGLCATTAHASDTLGETRYLSVKAQRAAIVDCQYEIGSRALPKMNVTYVESPFGGPSTLRLLPSSTIDQQTADWINACADKKLGRGTGDVVALPRQRRCNAVMMGGTSYCFE